MLADDAEKGPPDGYQLTRVKKATVLVLVSVMVVLVVGGTEGVGVGIGGSVVRFLFSTMMN